MDHKPIEIKCPAGCGQTFYETTAKYNPDKALNGHMFVLQKKWADRGWDRIHPLNFSTGNLECPGCGAALAPAGKLILAEPWKDEKPKPAFKCELCGKPYGTKRGLEQHMISMHGDQDNE